MKISEIRTAIDSRKTRSAWDRAVNAYAHELLDSIDPELTQVLTVSQAAYQRHMALYDTAEGIEELMLNGAYDWKHYSWGGCSLCYNWQIAERCCTPSELKRADNGNKRPNAREEWLDVQARALYQAAHIILNIVKEG